MVKSGGNPNRDKSTFRNLLNPAYLVICEYALLAQDQSISLIKLIDQASASTLPVTPARFTVVAEFTRSPYASPAMFQSSQPVLKVELENPSGKLIDLGEYAVSEMGNENPWRVHRLIMDMSMGIQFTQEGNYTFRVSGRTNSSDFEFLVEKSIAVLAQI